MQTRASANCLLAALAAVVFVASIRPGVASKEGHTVAPACQMLVSAAIYDRDYPPREVGLCNADEHCLDTQRFIAQQLGKTIPELTCVGVRESSPQAATTFFDNIYDNACLAAGLTLATGRIEGDERGLQKQIALCNRSPDKDACRAVLSALADKPVDLRGLTCE
ncbi:MAG TPA: hypothetical protein VLX44_03900 [Xanthobacteraceae bacterium]|nr:hypothetical protein [Xanthobacteraceae bacterium]